MKIDFAFDGAQKPGSNAVVSEVWLIEGPPELAAKIVARRSAAVDSKEPEKEIYLHLKAMDPVGRRVDPGERYLPEDRFYVDFATDDPFEAAEQYGLAVRSGPTAPSRIPTRFPRSARGMPASRSSRTPKIIPKRAATASPRPRATSRKWTYIRKTDFLNYSTIALRLVPDNYTPNNPQGWWDDKHWQEQGFYTPPYETTEKWGQAVQERGGLAITYFQSDRVSADFRKAHRRLAAAGHAAPSITPSRKCNEYLRRRLCGHARQHLRHDVRLLRRAVVLQSGSQGGFSRRPRDGRLRLSAAFSSWRRTGSARARGFTSGPSTIPAPTWPSG